MFHLKDVFFKDAPIEDKREAVNRFKKNCNLPVFRLAMETILKQLDKIDMPLIQADILEAVAGSG